VITSERYSAAVQQFKDEWPTLVEEARYVTGLCECYAAEYKEFWENCPDSFAHCQPGFTPERHKEWQDWFDMGGKVLLDYGCGGVAGIALAFPENRYIGVDIAERSLRIAATSLAHRKNWELHQTPVELSDFNADLLIAQQVMIHFASQEMLDEFLANVNRSGVGELLLETRAVRDGVSFRPTDPNSACAVGWVYLRKHLPNYTMRKCQPAGTYRFSRWVRRT